MARAAPSTSVGSSPELVLAPGVEVGGKYRLKEPLRQGGMGSVWVATHLLLDTPVAMKFMLNLAPAPGPPVPAAFRPDGDGVPSSSTSVTSRDRFDREAKAAAQIRSANVVQILDYGVDRGTPYIVMELLRGEDLGTRLKRMGRLPLEEVTDLVVAVARALQRAHDVGLVHRDLKPANIYLAREGDEIVPKVLDFGVAKVVQDRPVGEATIEGTLVGTPSYMSPEQAMAKSAVDHRADLWSLAVIVYRALTGVRPFQSESFMELVVQICTHPFEPPSKLVPELPPAIDAFLDRALQRDPSQRFQSAREMARALLAIVPSRAGDRAPDSYRAVSDRPAPMAALEGAPEAVTLAVTSPSGVSHSSLSRVSVPNVSSVSRQSAAHYAVPSSSRMTASAPPSSPQSGSGFRHLPPPPSAPSVPIMAASHAQRPPPKTGIILAIAISSSALALAGALLFLRTSREGFGKLRRHAEPAASASAATPTRPVVSAPSVVSAPMPPAPPPPVSASAVASVSAPAATEPAPAVSSSSAVKTRAAPKAAAPAKHVDCSSPYYWDSSGTKFIKPECL